MIQAKEKPDKIFFSPHSTTSEKLCFNKQAKMQYNTKYLTKTINKSLISRFDQIDSIIAKQYWQWDGMFIVC